MSETGLLSERVARQILQALVRQSGEINELIASLQITTPTAEFSQARLLLASVMLELFDKGIDPLIQRYRDLRPQNWT